MGCDYQFASNWVLGLAGDYSWANLGAGTRDPFFGGKGGLPTTATSTLDHFATITGRVGYSFDRAMVYAKGGAAWADGHLDFGNFSNLNGSSCGSIFLPGCTASGNFNTWGWTAGFGLEFAVVNNWTVFGEFNHYDFGTKTIALGVIDPGGGANNFGSALGSVQNKFDVIKLGVNYRFGMH